MGIQRTGSRRMPPEMQVFGQCQPPGRVSGEKSLADPQMLQGMLPAFRQQQLYGGKEKSRGSVLSAGDFN